MSKSIRILPLILLLAAPSLAQKVYIDYDESADFSRYRTFAWKQTEAASLRDTNALMDSRIKNAIEYQLTVGGLVEDPESPDLYVSYHGEESQELRFDTMDWGYGYPSRWHRGYPYGYGYGMGSTTTTVSTYSKGTLVIDAWDARTNKLVWRGTASGTIPENPNKVAKKIDKAVEKIAREWEKMR